MFLIYAKQLPLLRRGQIDRTQSLVKLYGGVPRQNVKIQTTTRLVGDLGNGQHQLLPDSAASVRGLNVQILQEYGAAQPRGITGVVQGVTHDVSVRYFGHQTRKCWAAQVKPIAFQNRGVDLHLVF